MNKCGKAALEYKNKFGFSPVAARTRTKKGTYGPWKKYTKEVAGADVIKKWYNKYPKAGVAIVTGGISNIIVLDVDKNHGGFETLENLYIPETITVISGGGGRHFYFKYPKGVGEISNFQNRDDLPGIDLRADGGLIFAPPSVHPSGNRYKFAEGKSPWEIEPAEAPEWLIKLIKSTKKIEQKIMGLDQTSGNNSSNSTISPVIKSVDEAVGIIEVFEEFSGQEVNENKKVCCPIHDDSNPSLSFNVEGNYANCFGCNFGGGPSNIVSQLLGIRVKEAAELIAERFNLPLQNLKFSEDKSSKEIREERELIENIYQDTLDFALSNLSKTHQAYLKNEYGLSSEEIDTFQFGFMPNTGLLEYLESKGYKRNEILKTGLFTMVEGNIIGVFSNAILIPYFFQERVRFFTGIAFDYEEKGKRICLEVNADFVSSLVKKILFGVDLI